MKKLSMLLAAMALGLWLGQAQAWWGDDWYDDNDWPVWTPMYWAEEFADEIDDDDDYWYGPYGPYPYYGYGYPAYGYGYPYYGYGYYPPYPYWRRHHRHWW